MKNKILEQAVAEASTIAIGGHIRPDGDCVGSCMGLYQYLTQNIPNVKVDVYLEEIPDSFRFLKDTEKICHQVKEQTYDLFICLDCGDAGRLGFSGELFEKAHRTLCIDHHVSNQSFADENYIVPEASSTSELIYRLLDPDKITKEIAECLYLGIVHDTGVFQYSCTAPETMEAAANLMRTGIDFPTIITKTFYEKTYAQNQILGKALLDSRLYFDGACIASVVNQETMDEYGVVPKDLDGIVSQLRVTGGVEVAVFLYETAAGEYKASLRSVNHVDVSKICGMFGGGGHVKAAGVTMKGAAESILNQLTEEIKKQL